MPNYRFHLVDGQDMLLDEDGREMALSDVAAAAMREARSLISDEVMQGRVRMYQSIEVTDASGVTVHRLPFADAVEIVTERS